MTSTGVFLKKISQRSALKLAQAAGGAPLWVPAAAVSVLSLVLRVWNSGHINNSISDLSARQALMAVDILRGHFHFPNGPWAFEYDEAGLAWLLAPWVKLFGHKWTVFKNFGAILAAFTPGVLTWVAGKRWDRRTGVIAGLLMATLPAQLVWDRHLVVCATAIPSIAWLIGLHLTSWREGSRRWSCFLAGLIIGFSTYVVHYSPLIVPVLCLVILLESRRNGVPWTRAVQCLVLHVLAVLAVTAPIIIHKIQHPGYLLWRKRHLMDFNGSILDGIQMYLKNLWGLFYELFIGRGNFYYLHDKQPVFTLVFSLLVAVGVYNLLKHDRRNIPSVLAMPILILLLLGLTAAENWRGVYHVHTMIFYSMIAAIGFSGMCQWTGKTLSRTSANRLCNAVLTGILVIHTGMFFAGPYQIHPAPYFLTRLQADMMTGRDMPYLFSSNIQEVYHYHFSFWFVTRVDHPEVSIFTWNADGFFTHPDYLPIEFEPNDDVLVGVVIRSSDLDTFIQTIGVDRIKSWRRLPRSGVTVVRCRIEVPDLLKRTWTDSLVPPILNVVKHP